jgi:hypothetical protein
MSKQEVRLFEEQEVRGFWDEDHEKWWFSVVDIVGILTEQINQDGGRNYWKVLKKRLKEEGSELVTICNQLKLLSSDGKKYLTDCLDTEGVLRLVQSIPSKKAEPFKLWLAKVGNQIIEEGINPELTAERMINEYKNLGYSESWINQRLKSIEVRKGLTDEWNKSDVQTPEEYAALTSIMSKIWSGLTVKEYKKLKDLKQENLRDHMTNTELVLNMLAEVSATEINQVRKPKGFHQTQNAAIEGAKTAKVARLQLEKSTGKSVISSINAKRISQNSEKEQIENKGGNR